jgi:hypothetical protein
LKISLLFFFPPSVVLFNAAFLCHKQIRCGLWPAIRSHDRHQYAYEKFGVLFILPSSPSSARGERSAREGSA